MSSPNPLVRKLTGFCELTEADQRLLEQITAKPSVVKARTDLICEGDVPDGVFLILEGFACRYKLRSSGARHITAYLLPGDLGDVDVGLLPRMDHTIGTLSPCRVVRLDHPVIEDLLQNHPRIGRALRIGKLVDEATLREWLVNVGCRTATERVAHLLCELLLRLRVVGLAPSDSYTLSLFQRDIADTTGLSNVQVNRSLQKLRRQGLIELRSKSLRILDLPGLQAVAEFKPDYLHLNDRTAA
ncbi:Crp/Fnr family transcriptional regulator [Methylobacterium iners]|uniref:Transcriptional activatory protein AadR n=1 Tax=Methylobacterium iners TaxID=418707 RepID=A0ABQ4RT35_9HYPH|nr:Crp/Fnr family transcriptional regulator [Methylobacterium iners]GJD93137.1 Transcriptional activatory protein AadR [Methylobacterium iners]